MKRELTMVIHCWPGQTRMTRRGWRRVAKSTVIEDDQCPVTPIPEWRYYLNLIICIGRCDVAIYCIDYRYYSVIDDIVIDLIWLVFSIYYIIIIIDYSVILFIPSYSWLSLLTIDQYDDLYRYWHFPLLVMWNWQYYSMDYCSDIQWRGIYCVMTWWPVLLYWWRLNDWFYSKMTIVYYYWLILTIDVFDINVTTFGIGDDVPFIDVIQYIQFIRKLFTIIVRIRDIDNWYLLFFSINILDILIEPVLFIYSIRTSMYSDILMTNWAIDVWRTNTLTFFSDWLLFTLHADDVLWLVTCCVASIWYYWPVIRYYYYYSIGRILSIVVFGNGVVLLTIDYCYWLTVFVVWFGWW